MFLDFDGVCIDTFMLCYELIHEYEKELSIEQYLKRFEDNGNLKGDTNANGKARAAEFFKKYEKAILAIPPVLGMSQAIELLSRRYAVVILSSTESAPIRRYLQTIGWDKYVADVIGADHGGSKAHKMTAVLTARGMRSNRAVLITDTVGDLKQGARASVASIGVGWGYHHTERLRIHSLIPIASRPEELAGLVDAVLRPGQ